MFRRLFKIGNSIILSLPQEALESLNLREGAEVALVVDPQNNQIIIKPAEAPLAAAGIDEDYARQISQFIDHYRPALEELAK
jgi:putative addiction module antidote